MQIIKHAMTAESREVSMRVITYLGLSRPKSTLWKGEFNLKLKFAGWIEFVKQRPGRNSKYKGLEVGTNLVHLKLQECHTG